MDSVTTATRAAQMLGLREPRARCGPDGREVTSITPAPARRVCDAAPTEAGPLHTDAPDALAAIDDVLDVWSARRQAFRRQRVEAEDERREFIRHAEGLASSVIRPTLEAVAQRLKACGGDGRLVERPMDAFHGLRLTLWMALDRPVEVLDRPDLYPYIRLDLDVANRRFTLWEGDMWERQGASRPTDPWELSDITGPVVTERVIAILRRAASHDVLT